MNCYSVVRILDPSDERLQKIISLQLSHRLSNHSREEEASKEGFLISGYSEVEFRSFIENDAWLFVAEAHEGLVIGYALATSGRSYLHRHPHTSVKWETNRRDLIDRFESGDFLYFDQLGVDQKWKGEGLAAALHREVLQSAAPSLVFGAVLVRPVKNVRSHRFLTRLGYEPCGVLSTPKIKDVNAVESTLFVLSSMPVEF